MIRTALATTLLVLFASTSQATVAFDQPHNGGATLHKSSWYPPDGLDGDVYCWDNFTVPSNTAITEVHWRGGYEFHASGSGQSPVYDFEVAIYRSIPGGSQPDMGAGGRLVRYYASGNAGETAAGTFAGMHMYDYAFTLPSPFQATGGTVYWVQIEAWQGLAAPSYAPDWGLAVGTGGNNSHFRKTTGANFQTISNDLAFSLMTTAGPTVTINASVLPAGSGTVMGAGSYPTGSTVSLSAFPGAGWGFVNWTENGTPVSTNANYSFTASVDRTLVANFIAAYTISTQIYPPYAGTATGDGVYNEGAPVTLVATPNPGFVFTGWSDGTLTPAYTFPAASDLIMTAFFESDRWSVTYDFDSGPAYTSLPLDLTVNGLTAHWAGNFSIQFANTYGFTPVGFSGLCLFPSGVFQSDLVVSFSERLTYFSVLYCPVEIACDQSALMRVTAFLDGVAVGTNTMRAVAGTYPTATLSIAVPGGFNSAVVHFDTPGWPCTDYAPIFLADIVTVTRDSTASAVGEEPVRAMGLASPSPNPFERSTTVSFDLPNSGNVDLRVFDVSGRVVRTLVDEPLSGGPHAITWDAVDDSGRKVAAGFYIVRLDAGGEHRTRRMLVVK